MAQRGCKSLAADSGVPTMTAQAEIINVFDLFLNNICVVVGEKESRTFGMEQKQEIIENKLGEAWKRVSEQS